MRNSRGRNYSDDSSSLWDVTAAEETGSGFLVLGEGSVGTAKEGYNHIWLTNSSGVITSGSGWLTDAQAASDGYENTFDKDLNNDGLTSGGSDYENTFGKDFNDDGLVSGGSAYQLFGSSDIYTMRNSRGRNYSDDSSSLWDVTAAEETGSGFLVLGEGSVGTAKEGYNHMVNKLVWCNNFW